METGFNRTLLGISDGFTLKRHFNDGILMLSMNTVVRNLCKRESLFLEQKHFVK